MPEPKSKPSITVRLSPREDEALENILEELKESFRQADIERNGFVTADPDRFVTRALAMRHAIVYTERNMPKTEAAA